MKKRVLIVSLALAASFMCGCMPTSHIDENNMEHSGFASPKEENMSKPASFIGNLLKSIDKSCLIKRAALVMSLALVATFLYGCVAVQPVGSPVPEVKIERREFVAQNCASAQKSIDCTQIVSFINGLNKNVDKAYQVTDYDMYYDKEESTVYVTSDATTLAFKVDDSGNVLFVSCTGPQAVKTALSQGIAKTYSGTMSKNVKEVFASVEAQNWLNSINTDFVNEAVDDFSMSDLDVTLAPHPPGTPPITIYDGFPTLTEALESYKLTDLDNYFEAPTLDKFQPIDNSSIQEEIDANAALGNAIKDKFKDASIETPDISEVKPEILDK